MRNLRNNDGTGEHDQNAQPFCFVRRVKHARSLLRMPTFGSTQSPEKMGIWSLVVAMRLTVNLIANSPKRESFQFDSVSGILSRPAFIAINFVRFLPVKCRKHGDENRKQLELESTPVAINEVCWISSAFEIESDNEQRMRLYRSHRRYSSESKSLSRHYCNIGILIAKLRSNTNCTSSNTFGADSARLPMPI